MCNTQACPCKLTGTEWTEWSDCTASCGDSEAGTKHRSKEVVNGTDTNCFVEDKVEAVICNGCTTTPEPTTTTTTVSLDIAAEEALARVEASLNELEKARAEKEAAKNVVSLLKSIDLEQFSGKRKKRQAHPTPTSCQDLIKFLGAIEDILEFSATEALSFLVTTGRSSLNFACTDSDVKTLSSIIAATILAAERVALLQEPIIKNKTEEYNKAVEDFNRIQKEISDQGGSTIVPPTPITPSTTVSPDIAAEEALARVEASLNELEKARAEKEAWKNVVSLLKSIDLRQFSGKMKKHQAHPLTPTSCHDLIKFLMSSKDAIEDILETSATQALSFLKTTLPSLNFACTDSEVNTLSSIRAAIILAAEGAALLQEPIIKNKTEEYNKAVEDFNRIQKEISDQGGSTIVPPTPITPSTTVTTPTTTSCSGTLCGSSSTEPLTAEIKDIRDTTTCTLDNSLVEAIIPGSPDNPKNVKTVEQILPESRFMALFPDKNAAYTYTNFLRAIGKFPAICNNTSNCPKILAVMFAHFQQETAGLFFLEEINKGAYCATWTDWVAAAYPCTEGKEYYGRGALQLSWNYNYGAFSNAMYGDASVLLEKPELVATTW